MLIDRPQIVEGSVIVNATVASGTADPTSPNVGELFYRTDLGQLRSYGGAACTAISTSGYLSNHVGDYTLHLTSSQNTLLDGLSASLTSTELNFVHGVTSSIQPQIDSVTTSFGTHAGDTSLHISANQNTFLDALNLPTLTAASVNALPAHLADYSMHITANQNTFLDALNLPSLTAADINNVPTINTNLSTLSSNFTTHAADQSLHLTSAQNTFIDGITVTYSDVNRLVNMDTYLASISATSVSSVLSSLSSGKVAKAGDTMTGNLIMANGSKITGLPTPSAATDAVNKAYVDMYVQGIHWTIPVDAATTGPITLSGLQTVDGIALVANNRVLVKDQSTPANNGIYLASSGAWSRVSDYDSVDEINESAIFVLPGGASNGRGTFLQTATLSNLGDAINYVTFSGPVVTQAGSGIGLSPSGVVSINQSYGLTFDGGSNLAVDVYASGGLMTTTDGSTSSTAATAQLSLKPAGTAGTYKSVTTDVFGRVTSGTNPTTLAGYGITDAQPLDSDLTAVAALSTNGIITRTGTGAVATRSIAVSGTGLSVMNGDGVAGNPTITSTATSANTVSTIVARDGSGNFTAGTGNFTAVNATTFTGTLSGNASTATTLATPRAINGTNFDGSAAITITASTPTVLTFNNGGVGAASGATFTGASAQTISYNTIGAPSTTGTNASGTWSINVSGNSATTTQRTFSNVRTDGINRGSYGSISVAGQNNTWAGIDFTDFSATLMINATQSGVYRTNNTWDWYFTNGTLTQGTIPAANVSGTVASASSATLATKASTLAQGGGDGTGMTFNWSGQGGTPPWVWGGSDGVNMYVYSPANFSVNYANSAGNANSISSATTGSYTWTGANNFISNANTGAQNQTTGSALMASTNNSSGAIMSFYRQGVYAVNMGLDSDNVFRIGGWSAPANLMQLTMSGSVTFAGDITAFSDVNMKTDISTIKHGLSKVEQMRGVMFTRKMDDARGTGVIAQEIEKVLPEVVKTNNDGTLSVAYGNVVGVLIEAIKELSEQNKVLMSRVSALEKQ